MLCETSVYSDLKPKMAKKLEVKTTKGSRVTPKTAGIESTANTISLSSITATVRSNGVACPKCFTPVRNQVKINLTQKVAF